MHWNIFRRYTMHTTWWSLSLWWPQLKGELRSNSAPSHWHRKGLARSKLLRPCLASRHGATLSQEWERAPYFGGGQTPLTISQVFFGILEVKHLLPFRKCCFAFSGNFCPLGAISCLVPRPGSCFSIQGKLLDRSYSHKNISWYANLYQSFSNKLYLYL